MFKPITFVESLRLNNHLGCQVLLASETLQYTGSFKFRAAYTLARSVPNELIITASSGNFGQALACACQILGKRCIVVMPDNSASIKVSGVEFYGGQVKSIDTTKISRADAVAQLAKEFPEAYVASAYDDPHVIKGNATLGCELADWGLLKNIIAPIGGGGLSSGIIQGLRERHSRTKVIGAEPQMANDASRSLAAGEIISNTRESQTIADGARTLRLGTLNWEILKDGLSSIIEVPENYIYLAVQLLFRFANLKVEPTGALSVAAILSAPDIFRGQDVCCVVSGGNVDTRTYIEILSKAV